MLNLLAQGDSYKACAERRIYERLHVHTSSAAVSKAMRHGWIR